MENKDVKILGVDIANEEDKSAIQTITDEQIEEVIKVLHPEDQETPEHFPFAVLNKEGQMEKGIAAVAVNENGMSTIVGAPKEGNVSFSDIIDGTDKEKLDNITKEASEGLTGLGLSEEDAMALYSIIIKHRKGEKFNIYNELPNSVKDMVHGIAMSKNPRVLTEVSKGIVEFFSNQLNIEQEFIDLQDSIKRELDMPGMVDMYAEHLVKSMEDDLLAKADAIEAEYPDKAEDLRRISNTYTRTYKFDNLHLELDSNPKIVKKINKDLKKFARHCREFNFKYQNSKFKINSVTLLEPTIMRHVECTKEDAQKFILLFTNICRDMKSDNLLDHTFMYYTIKNILTIDHIQKDSEFKDTIINGIKEVIEKINKLEKEVIQ